MKISYIGKWQILWLIIVIIIYIFGIVITLIIKPKNIKLNKKVSRDDFLFTIKIFFIILSLIIIGIISGFIEYGLKFEFLNNILIIFAMFIIISPAEEIIFRGIIQNFFVVNNIGQIKGLFLTSLIYGLIHLPNDAQGSNILLWNWKLVLIATIVGLFFGWTYIRTKSIINPIILHALIGSIYFIFLR